MVGTGQMSAKELFRDFRTSESNQTVGREEGGKEAGREHGQSDRIYPPVQPLTQKKRKSLTRHAEWTLIMFKPRIIRE